MIPTRDHPFNLCSRLSQEPYCAIGIAIVPQYTTMLVRRAFEALTFVRRRTVNSRLNWPEHPAPPRSIAPPRERQLCASASPKPPVRTRPILRLSGEWLGGFEFDQRIESRRQRDPKLFSFFFRSFPALQFVLDGRPDERSKPAAAHDRLNSADRVGRKPDGSWLHSERRASHRFLATGDNFDRQAKRVDATVYPSIRHRLSDKRCRILLQPP